MSLLRWRRGELTSYVLERRLWGERPLFLLDVGCSGGIEKRWRAFGDRLRAVGFDPLVAEIDRLIQANEHPHTRYEAASVTCHNYDALFPRALRQDRTASKNNDPYERSSAAAAVNRQAMSYVQEVFNKGAPLVIAERSIVLDDYLVTADERASVDFIKIDTDGHDLEVLLGSEAIMAAGGVLGLSIEAQFHGPVHDYANTFANIDRVMRQRGFTLFDLQSHRYSRAHLPAPFVGEHLGATTSGQLFWGEALYFRDLGSPDYERMWPIDVTPERVMKLACLFDQFNLPDCAAELILNRGGFLESRDREALLDALVSRAFDSYSSLIECFEGDHTRFYPSQLHKLRRRDMDEAAAVAEDPLHSYESTVVQRMRELVDKYALKNAQLVERLQHREGRIEALKQRVDELKQRVKALQGEQ